MTDRSFEDALRATLRAAAPLEVPTRLDDRARAIPAAGLLRPRWQLWAGLLGDQAALSVVVVAAVFIGSFLVLGRPTAPGTSGGSVPNPVTIESPFGSLAASDLQLTVAGRPFRVPSAPSESGVQTMVFTGSSTFGQITLAWRDGGNPVVLVLHLEANARTWWVSDIVATDGRPEAAGWVYFKGPIFESLLGSTFEGNVVLSSVRSTYGETASLRFGNLRMTAFSLTSPRVPTQGTMPPSGIIGAAGPDFIPMVEGNQLVGYVSSRWLDLLPITSFRGQDPDQPVFGPDLKTLIGYLVPNRGFEPTP